MQAIAVHVLTADGLVADGHRAPGRPAQGQRAEDGTQRAHLGMRGHLPHRLVHVGGDGFRQDAGQLGQGVQDLWRVGIRLACQQAPGEIERHGIIQ